MWSLLQAAELSLAAAGTVRYYGRADVKMVQLFWHSHTAHDGGLRFLRNIYYKQYEDIVPVPSSACAIWVQNGHLDVKQRQGVPCESRAT